MRGSDVLHQRVTADIVSAMSNGDKGVSEQSVQDAVENAVKDQSAGEGLV